MTLPCVVPLLQLPRRALACALGLALVAATAGYARDPAPNPTMSLADVRGLIDGKGARDALWTISHDDARWDALLDDVASGKDGWLQVAAQFHPVADARANDGLNMAMQMALPRNAPGVLGVVASGAFSVHDACGMYGFGQRQDTRPPSVLVGLVDRRIAAVRAVEVPRLTRVRDGCLAALQTLRKTVESHGTPTAP